MRQRVTVECSGTEYDCRKLDAVGRVGSMCNDDRKGPGQGQGQGSEARPPKVYIYGVHEEKESTWKPKPLPLRRFNRVCESSPPVCLPASRDASGKQSFGLGRHGKDEVWGGGGGHARVPGTGP